MKKLISSFELKYSKYIAENYVLNPINRIKEYISYLENAYGENILINSRYPINLKQLSVNKKDINFDSVEFVLKIKIVLYSIKKLDIFYQSEKLYKSALNSGKEEVINLLKKKWKKMMIL